MLISPSHCIVSGRTIRFLLITSSAHPITHTTSDILTTSHHAPLSHAAHVACAIQDCLSKHNYSESACQSYVESLYKCCDRMYREAEKRGKSPEQAKSTACPIKSVVDRKMRVMGKGSGS